MNLSALLISWHLKEKYQARCSNWLSREPHLKGARCYNPSLPLEPDMVYVVNSKDFVMPLRSLTRMLILFTGRDWEDIHTEVPNVCLLPPEVSATEVLEFLLEIFSRYSNWRESLMEAGLRHGSLQDLLDLTDPVIPNPMMVIRRDFALLASKGISYGELRDSLLGTNEETLDLVNSLKEDPVYEETAQRKGYYFYPGNDVASPQLCVNMPQSGPTQCRLMMGMGEVPLDDTFGFLLEILSDVLTHLLPEKETRDSSSSLRQIFRTLLSDPRADYVEISRLLTARGWLSSHYYQCILIQTGISDLRSLTLHSICSYVENMIPASCALEFKGNAVVFVDLDLCPLPDDQISQKMAAFIRDSLLMGSYSRKLLGHFNFHRQYVQASITLDLGKRLNPSRWIHHFNDVAMPYLMEQATKKLPGYMVCHEKLLNLKNMSDSTNSHLYETFRCYLENHLNVTRTAQALFIHRSTLLYRLEKIRAIVNPDLDDPGEMLYLLLSFALMDREE